MKPPPPPVPGNTEWELFDNAVGNAPERPETGIHQAGKEARQSAREEAGRAKAALNMTDRIPLCRGIHIRFSKDGRALYGGCHEDEIVPIVEVFCRGTRGEFRNQLECWLEQKEKQVAQDAQVQRERKKRGEIDARIWRYVSGDPILGPFVEEIRMEIYRRNGISMAED